MNQQSIDELKKKIVPVLKEAGVTRAAIFGSVARGDATEKSDVDILVDFPRDKSFLAFAHLKTELEDSLQKKVDLVEFGMIREELKPFILNDQLQIL